MCTQYAETYRIANFGLFNRVGCMLANNMIVPGTPAPSWRRGTASTSTTMCSSFWNNSCYMFRISIVLPVALNASSDCTFSDFCWNFLSWYISLFLNQLLHCSVAWEPWMQGAMDHRRWERLSCRGWCNLSVSSLHEYMNTKRHDVNVYVLHCTSTYAHCTDICCIKPQTCQDHKLSSLC